MKEEKHHARIQLAFTRMKAARAAGDDTGVTEAKADFISDITTCARELIANDAGFRLKALALFSERRDDTIPCHAKPRGKRNALD